MSTTQLQQQVASYRQASYLYMWSFDDQQQNKKQQEDFGPLRPGLLHETQGPFLSLLVSSFLEKAGELLLISIGS